MRHRLVALIACYLPGSAAAQSILEQLREYDLNDYAFGIAISASQNPYLGSDHSVFAYPYLTSFRHSAFTDSKFLIADSNVGFRWTGENGLDLGVVGRVQTLGFGDVAADELRGMRDRNWTIEAAPMINWRAWPIHLTLRHYREVLDKHDGGSTELAVSYPREYDWGYVVPHVEAIWRDSKYSNYYFGVSPSESLPNRPAYTPGSSVSMGLRLSFGYTLSNRWLVTGGAGIEFLASEIRSSPTVADDNLLSFHLGLAYNSDLFQPRNSHIGDKQQARLEIRAAAVANRVNSKVRRNRDTGVAGTEIDLEDSLGLSDSETMAQIDITYRINAHHRIETGYFGVNRQGSRVLEQDITFGSASFQQATTVDSRVESETWRLSYGYSLINDTQKELGVTAGIHVTRSIIDLIDLASTQRESSYVSTPLPVVGAFATVEVGERSRVGAEAQIYGTEFDRYNGSALYASVEWRRRFGNNFSAGLGYRFYTLNLESADSGSLGEIKVRHQGPAAFFAVRF